MFLKLILTAQRLKKRKQDVEIEKHLAWEESKDKEAKMKLKQKYRRWYLGVAKLFTFCSRFPKNSCMYRSCFNLQNEGTLENFTFKSILGFLGGFILTYIFFMFFVLQLNFKLSTATIMCSIFGSVLTIGLAFSYKVRCIVFLVLPQFFSKKGRQALLAYAYILAITGPAKNTLNNMSILGESLACGQEQLKSAVRQIMDVIKKPFYAIRDAIKAVVKAVKEIVVKIKEILLSIKKIIMSLVKIMKAAFKFIANVVNVCNREVGTPFQRCVRVFENAITDCNAKLGPLFSWLCNITYLGKAVCYLAKTVDFMCSIIDFVKDTVGIIVTKVKQFVRHIRVMFYVRIKFSHSFHFETNHSRSMNDITTGIVTEIKQRSSGLIKIFDFMSCAASLFFIFMIFKVIYYRHKFLTNERFDNKFITKDFRQIDLKRAQMGLETVLPLNHRERRLYIKSSSLRLVTQEISELSHSAMILLMTTLKLATHMATDYSLWWIMTLIRYYGRFQSKIPTPNVPTLNIEGTGFLAALLRGIVLAFRPIGINLEIDTIPCLPDPIPPDYDRYIQIATLLLLCWFLAVFEPYGLRFRHSVMCYYHPQRARERSIWLYNHILRSRSSFLKFARRQLRRKIKGEKGITKVTFKEFLRSKLNCKFCHMILPSQEKAACLLCGEVFRDSDHPIQCQTPNCPGIYCERCFNDLQNLCTVCLDPIQYGDLSDVSEEKGSTDDSQSPKNKKRKKKKKKKPVVSANHETTSTEDEDTDHSDKKKLLDKKGEKDSDYFSSQTGFSSDYSYTYQENKDISKEAEKPTKSKFVDVEKQNIPEHATMQDLQNKPSNAKADVLYSTPDSSNITELNTTPDLNNLQTPTQGKISKRNFEGVEKQPKMQDLQNSPTNTNHEVFYSTPDSSNITELNTSPDFNNLQTPTSDLNQPQPSTPRYSHPQPQIQREPTKTNFMDDQTHNISEQDHQNKFNGKVFQSKPDSNNITELDANNLERPTPNVKSSSGNFKHRQPTIPDLKHRQALTRDSKLLQPTTQNSKDLQASTFGSKHIQPSTGNVQHHQPPIPDLMHRQASTQDSKLLQPTTQNSKDVQAPTFGSKHVQPSTGNVQHHQPPIPNLKQRQASIQDSKLLQPTTRNSKDVRAPTFGSKHVQPSTGNVQHHQPPIPDLKHHQTSTQDSKLFQPTTRNSKDVQAPTFGFKHVQPSTGNVQHHQPPIPDLKHRQTSTQDSKLLQPTTRNSKDVQAPTFGSKHVQPSTGNVQHRQPPIPDLKHRQRDSRQFQQSTQNYKQLQPPTRDSKHFQPTSDFNQLQPPAPDFNQPQPSIKSCKVPSPDEMSPLTTLDFSSSPITEEEGNARVIYLNKTYKRDSKISADSIPMKTLLSDRSRRSKAAFHQSPTQVYHFTVIHPDVPRLNLNFEGKEEGQCTASTTSLCAKQSCNCRFFRDVVKFGSVSETRRSPDGYSSSSQATTTSSSSLISSLNKMPRTSFGVSMADTNRTCDSAVTPTSEAEDARKRFNKYRLHDSYRSALSPKSTFSDSILDSNMYDIPENVRRRNIFSSSQKWYKDKVTEYYSHIKDKKHKPYFPPKQTQSVLKRFVKLFKGNKKNSIL